MLKDNFLYFFPQVSSPWSHTQLVMLLSAVVCSVPRNASIPNWDRIIKDVLQLATQHTHRLSQEEASKCLAGLLNKHNAGKPNTLDSFFFNTKNLQNGEGKLGLIIYYTVKVFQKIHTITLQE